MINELAEQIGVDLTRKLDKAVCDSLKKQAPVSYWLLWHLRWRWLAKLLRLEILNYQQLDRLSFKYEFRLMGKTIGRAEIAYDVIYAK